MFPYEETPGPHLDHPAGTSWFAANPFLFGGWLLCLLGPEPQAPEHPGVGPQLKIMLDSKGSTAGLCGL